jgi:hypothetical protein
MVPNARFTELLADIEPSPTTKSNASSAHTNLRAHLRGHKDFANLWQDDFLAGSYSRDTAIRPRKTEDGHERSDVDIIVVGDYRTDDDPEAVLFHLADVLEDEYEIERINKRSVRAIDGDSEMDVVPVIAQWDGSYLIADRETGLWIPTNPPKHNEWSSARNKEYSGRFKPLVKMQKWWKRENPTGKRPKGFVLEVFTTHAPTNETHYGEAFAQMLENIYNAYKVGASLGIKPAIADPAIPTNDILAKVTVAQWQAFIEKVRVHAGYARRAQTEDDMEEATRLWRKVFGDRFKATANVAKAASSSMFATAPAPTGYQFPNAPAAPNKPRGFA